MSGIWAQPSLTGRHRQTFVQRQLLTMKCLLLCLLPLLLLLFFNSSHCPAPDKTRQFVLAQHYSVKVGVIERGKTGDYPSDYPTGSEPSLFGVIWHNPLPCTALHCIPLYYTVLHYTALHYNIPQCSAVHCVALQCSALHCNILQCSTLYCIVLYCTALHFTTLQCSALYCFALHCIAL